MKKQIVNKTLHYATALLLLLVFSANLTSCVVRQSNRHHREQKIPPGQHKKIHGDRSAKRYAPGQQKKQYKKANKHYNDNKGNKHKRSR